jgi:hypothetical protein
VWLEDVLHEATYRFVGAVARRRQRGEDAARAVTEAADDVAEEALGVRPGAIVRRARQKLHEGKSPPKQHVGSRTERTAPRRRSSVGDDAARAYAEERARCERLKRDIDEG